MPPTRILVVDDFRPWRHMVTSILEGERELQVIGEAADGVDAVEKAEKMKPDLITLDIGLPRLDGIRAAMRISEVSPASKILFISQCNDLELVRTALGSGSAGYLHKPNLRKELLPAVTAILGGSTFLGSGMGAPDRGRVALEEMRVVATPDYCPTAR